MIYFIVYLAMLSVILWVAYVIIQLTLDQNLKNRTFDELHAKVRMQVTMTDKIFEREYLQLQIIERILTSEDDEIEAEQFNAVWEIMQEKENVTMLGFADLSGNVINCNGEKLGNIGNRDYFIDIIEGRATEKCVRLDSTIRSDDSELLYAIPFYIKDKIGGVLFKSKRIADVEDTIVEDIQFDGSASMFVVDKNGDIILVGDKDDRFLLVHNLFEQCENFQFTDDQIKELKQNISANQVGEVTFKQKENTKYAVYSPSGVEDWTIFSMVDKDVAAKQYKNSDEVIENSMILIVILFFISMIVSIILIILHVRKQKLLKLERFYQYRSYKKIMDELTFPVFRYNVKEDQVTGNRKFQEEFSKHVIENFLEKNQKWKAMHPEYNFDGLFSEINKVIKERKIITFESVLNMETAKNRWIKTILIPVTDENGEELIVFGTIMDTTQEHKQFEEIVGMTEKVPVGLYRVYLNDPFHLEYVNEGFSRMLGYTQAEMNAIIGDSGNYAKLLESTDWEKIKKTTQERIMVHDSDTREYKMRCKDGSLMMVSDTMEVKYDSEGAKYGYGVVVDISKYREAQEQNEKKLEKLKIQLNESRIKISTGQMQPHFLYNSLASIREVVLENPEYAADLIFDFTTHLRACIKSMASEDLISFSQEIENIKAYVNIEKMRFGEKMQVQYDIQEQDFNIVPLSVQPLVENAIRHGIYERGSKGGVVKISSYRDAQEVVIVVEDNGVGFDVQKIKKEVQEHERDSTGLQSLIFRFEHIMNAQVIVESVVGEGTRITVKIPVKGE